MRAFRPFDPVAKRAEADVEANGARFTVAKGAPQVILDLCKPDAAERKAIGASVDRDAAKGYRTLGVARLGRAGRLALSRAASAVRPASRRLRRDDRDDT